MMRLARRFLLLSLVLLFVAIGGTGRSVAQQVLGVWNNATGSNSTQILLAPGNTAIPALLLQFDQTTTITGGIVTLEGTFDGINWVTVPAANVVSPSTLAPIGNPYTFVASTNQPFLIFTGGFQSLRIRLSTVITGTGAVTPYVTPFMFTPTVEPSSIGTQGDTAWVSGNGSLVSILKSIASGIAAAIPAGTNVIGKVGVDQTTPGTTNGVALVGVNGATALAGNGTTGTGSPRVTLSSDNSAVAGLGAGATGSAPPANAVYAGANSSGNLTGLIQADKSVAINVSTATTTQLVAISGSTKIYVTSFDIIAGGTGNITFEYGTGASCGTGTTTLTGAYNLVAQAGIAKGNGGGPILVVPAGNALCVLTSAAVQMSGSVSYTQF